MQAAQLIEQLQLQPHPEGGYYREMYRSAATVPVAWTAGGADERNACTAIYYLLERGDFSGFHRIKSDELWHFYAGGVLLLHLLYHDGRYEQIALGNELPQASFFALMPAGVWFAAEPAPGTLFTLAGCTVSPGFDFRDFEMAGKADLLAQWPQHAGIIGRLCR
jgi:predicted cupin superfamily sugar epimerase